MESGGRSVTDGGVRSAPFDICVQAIEPLLFWVVGFVADIDAPAHPNQSVLSGFALERSSRDAMVGT